MVDVTLNDYISFYHGSFKTAFSKYTGFVLEKDESILTSIESSHSHLMQYFQHKDVNASVAQQNLSKAMGHLQRATLDCYKLLWVYLDQEIQELIVDPEKRLSCIKLKEEDLLQAYRTAKKQALEVRQAELQNVGVNIDVSIEKYAYLISLGEHVMEYVDDIALSMYDARKKRKWYRDHLITFILGIIASLIGTLLLYHI